MLWDCFQSKSLKLSKTQLDIHQHPIGRQTQHYNIQILSFEKHFYISNTNISILGSTLKDRKTG